MKDTGNKIVLSAPQTELNTRITLGNIPPTTVTYNGNTNIAGTVPVDALTYTESATVTVLGNPGSLTKTGYAFTGWNTLANGLGTDYASSSTFVMRTTDVTLYAKWTLWYDSAWTYRKEITINHELVGNGTENETNFPVLISLSGLSHVNVAGTDIRFTLSNHTTLLPREIESYSAGTLYAWVKIPTLSYTADTVIYMYYGNTDATEPTPASTYGSQNVWDGNFSVVYHLTETAGKHLDSTANDYDSEFSDISAPNNGVNVQTQGSATGKIGGADYLSGNFVSWPNGVGVTDVGRSKLTPSILTVSIWAKKEAGESMGWIFSRSCSDYGVSWQGTSYNYYFNGVNGGTLNVTIPESEYNNWHHLVIVFDGSNKKAYLDGTLMATEAQTYWSWYNYYPYKMQFLIGGYRCWDASESLYNGTVDEAHFSNTARSAGWIKTEYNNQNSPSTFYEVTSTDSI